MKNRRYKVKSRIKASLLFNTACEKVYTKGPFLFVSSLKYISQFIDLAYWEKGSYIIILIAKRSRHFHKFHLLLINFSLL